MNYMNEYEKFRNNPQYYDYSLSYNMDAEGVLLLEDISANRLLEILNKYPGYYSLKLKKTLESNYPDFGFMLGSGSEYLIWYLNNFLFKNKHVGVVMPNFYRIYETLRNPHYIYTEGISENGHLDSNVLKIEICKLNLDAVWISNPNPITGQGYYSYELEKIISDISDMYFIIDEVSIDSIMDREKYSLLESQNRYKNLIVIRTFSKFYGFPGMRLGYAAMNKNLAAHMDKNKQIFPVNGLALILAEKILKNHLFYNEIREQINSNKLKLQKLISLSKKLEFIHSLSNTMLLVNKSPQIRIWDTLADKGILTFDVSNEQGISINDGVRITIHSDSEIFTNLYNKIQSIC